MSDSELDQTLENWQHRLDEQIRGVHEIASLEDIEALRIKWLGRRGELTQLMRELSPLIKALGDFDPDAQRRAGTKLNSWKDALASALNARLAELGRAALEQRLLAERADVTLPVPFAREGRIHPISQTIDEIVAIFGEMGFVVAEGPHIEEDFYNFTALNIPPEHPARQEHDTFYLPQRADGTRLVLRTHTSPVQIRTMLAQQPPIRIIVPGRTFRCDHDATHSPMFHQVEGLVIDRATHMGHLKGCLIEFCRAFFGLGDLPVRFRPSYFPFTEPSAEVDIGCSRQGGRLEIGAGGDWLEILGSGMVHPNVLRNCGIDPAQYQGFAFGMGIERVAMLKYGIPDLRAFYDSDLRWLRHYGFLPLDIPSMVRGPLDAGATA
ncbi:MAG TPA: phenylalanine--tRNA ligase subunit alpha [Stellaceae bacterium]|jgi:phenylalanyl-tRNA synthetase alpha chain